MNPPDKDIDERQVLPSILRSSRLCLKVVDDIARVLLTFLNDVSREGSTVELVTVVSLKHNLLETVPAYLVNLPDDKAVVIPPGEGVLTGVAAAAGGHIHLLMGGTVYLIFMYQTSYLRITG